MYSSRFVAAALVVAAQLARAGGPAWEPIANLEDREAAARVPNTYAPEIFNGMPTSDYPAVVAVISSFPDDIFGLCTGTLIAPAVILTAAHCLNAGPLQVTVAFVLNGSEVDRAVDALAIHPRYVSSTLNADAALLRLAQPIEGVTPMPLARAKPGSGRSGAIVGFGLDGRGKIAHRQVGSVHLADCPQSLQHAERLLCWNSDRGGSNTCDGDSGGPLLVNGRVAGITSWSRTSGCGPSSLTVDTSVAAVRRWIRATVGVTGARSSTS
jgi:secreted trypsin-like serine protease